MGGAHDVAERQLEYYIIVGNLLLLMILSKWQLFLEIPTLMHHLPVVKWYV